MRFGTGYFNRLATLAASALILASNTTSARADENAPASPTDPKTVSSPKYATFTSPPHAGPLQRLGGDTFENNGIVFRGYIEGGYIFSFDRPQTDVLGFGVLFNDQTDDLLLNQVSLVFGREAMMRKDRADFGFITQVIYGADARYTQANGTNFYGSRWANDFSTQNLKVIPPSPPFTPASPASAFQGNPLRNAGQTDTENQFDVLQAAVTLALPLGEGMSFTGGKFVTPWGMETVDPTMSTFYSHSYIFALSQPKTLTGLSMTGRINPDLAIMGGVVRGWDQSLEDNNDLPSFVGQVQYRIEPEWLTAFTVMVGPELTDDDNHFRWLLNFTSTYQFGSDTKVGMEAVLGYEPNSGSDYVLAGDPSFTFFVNTLAPNFEDSYWAGLAGYMEQQIDPAGQMTFLARGEYFNDTNGARGLATEIWSGTLGLKIVPFPQDKNMGGLIIRPEFRWDYAIESIFDDNRRNTQISIGADVIYEF